MSNLTGLDKPEILSKISELRLSGMPWSSIRFEINKEFNLDVQGNKTLVNAFERFQELSIEVMARDKKLAELIRRPQQQIAGEILKLKAKLEDLYEDADKVKDKTGVIREIRECLTLLHKILRDMRDFEDRVNQRENSLLLSNELIGMFEDAIKKGYITLNVPKDKLIDVMGTDIN